MGSEGSSDDISESFAFALVNGALGVFEVHGRRIRDFRYYSLHLLLTGSPRDYMVCITCGTFHLIFVSPISHCQHYLSSQKM